MTKDKTIKQHNTFLCTRTFKEYPSTVIPIFCLMGWVEKLVGAPEFLSFSNEYLYELSR